MSQRMEQQDSSESKPWLCACGFSNRPINHVCGGTGPLGCKAHRPHFSSVETPEDQIDNIEQDGELPPERPGTLRLVTYNIHFGKHRQQVRMQAIAGILTLANADIVALQEVTDALLPLLMSYLEADLWQVFTQMPTHPEDMFVFEANYYTVLLIKKHLHVTSHRCVPWRETGSGFELGLFRVRPRAPSPPPPPPHPPA